jgi:hypothetical protein
MTQINSLIGVTLENFSLSGKLFFRSEREL